MSSTYRIKKRRRTEEPFDMYYHVPIIYTYVVSQVNETFSRETTDRSSLFYLPYERQYKLVIRGEPTSIGNFSFQNSAHMISVEIPDSVRAIGKGAFRNCTSLKSIKLPSSLVRIEEGAFRGCVSLTIDSLQNVEQIGSYSFFNCNLLNLSFPNSIRVLGNYAFSENKNLKHVSFDSDATTRVNLGKFLFANCKSLTTLVLPKFFQKKNEFNEFPGHLPGGICNDCTSLKKVEGLEHASVIGSFAFENTPLKKVVFGEALEIIGTKAFASCNSIKDLNLPLSISRIDTDAFTSCKRLTRVELFINNTTRDLTIDMGAFSGCISLRRFFTRLVDPLLVQRHERVLRFKNFWDGTVDNIFYPNGMTDGKQVVFKALDPLSAEDKRWLSIETAKLALVKSGRSLSDRYIFAVFVDDDKETLFRNIVDVQRNALEVVYRPPPRSKEEKASQGFEEEGRFGGFKRVQEEFNTSRVKLTFDPSKRMFVDDSSDSEGLIDDMDSSDSGLIDDMATP